MMADRTIVGGTGNGDSTYEKTLPLFGCFRYFWLFLAIFSFFWQFFTVFGGVLSDFGRFLTLEPGPWAFDAERPE